MLIACLLMLAVTACANGRATDTFCATARPIYPTLAEVDAASPETVTSILSHNEYGAERCGWKKPEKTTGRGR